MAIRYLWYGPSRLVSSAPVEQGQNGLVVHLGATSLDSRDTVNPVYKARGECSILSRALQLRRTHS
jgi:hypothetical protein